ncbi:MAG: putative Ig domain-containing protein [Woeseiaceae bacterium]
MQTRLLPDVHDAIAGAATREFSVVEESLSQKRSIDPAGALEDIIDVARFLGADFIGRGWAGLPVMVGEWVREARLDPALAATLDTMRVKYRSDYGIHGTAVGDVLVGTHWEPPFPSLAVPTIAGGYGDDLVFSDGDFEILFGGPGNDILHGGAGDEIIAPGLGRDIIIFGRGSGVDQVDSSRDSDILRELSSATLLPASDRDVVYMLPGVTPDDVRVRWMAAPHYAYTGPFSGGYLPGVRLSIIGTNDALYDAGFSVGGTTANNARSIEEVRFQDGTVWDLATLRLKQIEGSESNDRSGEAGFLRGFDDLDDVIDAKGGDDRLEGLGGDDTLIGGAGNDELLGSHGDDILYGGDGNDLLEGDFGADVLHGGKGDDLLYGGPGIDTYVIGANTGFDTLNFGNALTFGFEFVPLLDVLRFEADVTPSQVRLQRRGSGLHLFVDGTDSHVFDIGNPSNPDYLGESFRGPSIGRIEFADGTLWDGAEIKRRSLLGASEGDDRLYGFELSGDEIRGLSGNDVINGGRGDDSLFGDAGDDTLHGDDGNDLIDGGAGADVLFAGNGTDTMVFGPGDGNDTAHSIEVLRFTAVNAPDVDAWRAPGGLHFQLRATGDTVSVVDDSLMRVEFTDGTVWDQHDLDVIRARGTSGDDYLEGTEGDDVIAGLEGNDQLFGFGGNDELDGGPGQDWMHGGAGDDRYIVDDTFDRVFENAGEGHDAVLSSTGFTLGANVEYLSLTGDGSVHAFGNSLDNVLTGNAGGNHLNGMAGADVMRGGAGDDRYSVDNAMDSVIELAGEGIDTVFSSISYTLGEHLENLTLEGFGGDLSASGNSLDNILAGNQGSNLLRGWAGADRLAGGYGADTYLFAPGDGADVVYDDGSGGERNVLVLESIFPDQVSIEGTLISNVILRIGASGDQVTLLAPEGAGLAVAEIQLADGSIWTQQDIADQLPPPPPPPGASTEGDDVLTGSEASDVLIGLAGDDVLMGNAGDDFLDGGTGNDLLDGGAGSDIYLFRAGDGVDLVLDEPSAAHYVPSDPDSLFALYVAGELNALQFGAGILPADISLRVEDDVLRLVIGNEGDTLLIPGFDLADPLGAHAIKAFFFEETGELLAYADLLARGYEIAGGNSAPELVNALEDQVAHEDVVFAFTLPADAFSDPDAGDTLTYAADGLSAWLSFDPDTRTFSGTPLQADVGAFNVQVTATDAGGLAVSDELAIGVANVNDAPQLVRPIDDQGATEDAPFAFQVPADTFVDEDPDDALAWFARRPDGSALPAWLTFDAIARTLSGTPANEDVGPVEVELAVEDAAGLAASSTFTLTVANANDAPTLELALPDLAATEDQPFVFSVPAGTFSDVDAGDMLDLSVQLADGSPLPVWLLSADGTIVGTPLNADVGSYEIRMSATDAAGASVSDVFRLDVTNVNDAPAVASPMGELSFEAGSPFTFAVPAGTFVDEDAGDALTLSASLFGGAALPAWLAFDPASATFSGNPGKKENGISHVVLTATDRAGASVSSEFGLVVQAKAGSTVTGGKGDDAIYGGGGNEVLVAKGGDDALFGGAGSDLLFGGKGNDVLQGGEGGDVLHGGKGQNLLDGGSGNDLIFGGQGSSLIIGGTGNDIIHTGRGSDVLLFNRGDGADTVIADRAGDNTLSFGGGIRYSDLSLSRSGKDLVVSAGGDDRVVLKNWYSGKRSILNLQIVADASSDFDAASFDPLHNRRVQTFDFLGLVSAFDQGRRHSPGLTSWAITNALLQFHLSGADDMAFGGDLAYWYGKNRSLAGISLAAAQQVIGVSGFGSDAQTLRPFSGLQEGFVKLA